MHSFYQIFIRLYGLSIKIASFFNAKAHKLVLGRNNWERNLTNRIKKSEAYCWIHCASAGEFEQAIPLLKNLRVKNSDLRIAVSFFSPSGFEMYQDSKLADLFFYFPLDTKQNAAKLVEILNPEFVIFIRNEIWWNVLSILKEKNIPTYLVNANSEQKRTIFYQYYLDKTYPLFTKIFDTKTFGNTKLDKVIENKNVLFSDQILEDFCKDSFVIIAGSSWQTEESFIALFYKAYAQKYPKLRIIIAPHEFNEIKRDELEKTFSDWQVPEMSDVISYSTYSLKQNKRVLFLDKIGILKYAYRYADIAIIGGGFGKSVHNVSEAAVYGIPTLFGPNYHKFEETIALVNGQVAFSINDYKEFESRLLSLIADHALRNTISDKLYLYFSAQSNVSKHIINEIFS
jgi:3-deoxy-D-manno-octulosonic-acid transferase